MGEWIYATLIALLLLAAIFLLTWENERKDR